MKNKSKQAYSYITIILFIMSVGCNNKNIVPRSVETLSYEKNIPYAIKSKYQKALYRLDSSYMYSLDEDDQDLVISIKGYAKSLIDNKNFKFVPRKFILKHNFCKIIALYNNNFIDITPLQICYVDHFLYVDPNVNDKYQASFFKSSSLWKFNTLVKFNTNGLASLNNVNMKIKLDK